jgi:hypothetical protein
VTRYREAYTLGKERQAKFENCASVGSSLEREKLFITEIAENRRGGRKEKEN